MKIGLIRERKNPPDRRVAFLPEQCAHLQIAYPNIHFKVEPSEVRCLSDDKYRNAGIEVSETIKDCDILFGIKEVPPADLLAGKIYFIFSHTIKKQAHNRALLQAALEKKITLVDYECLLDDAGNRTVAFGHFAGIVGAYNAFRMWLFRYHSISLKPASECGEMEEMLSYARNHIRLLGPIKIAITGSGRVGHGAVEVLKNLKIRQVEPDDYLTDTYQEPVFTVISSKHYLRHPENEVWNEAEFRKNPQNVERHFQAYAECTNMLIACAYWDPSAPVLFTREEAAWPDFKISVISDVTCDLDGSVPTTVRTSTIANPFYDINPQNFKEEPAFSSNRNISVCAVDNLPCELPYDASKAFGEMLIKNIMPGLVEGESRTISEATIAKDGKLMPKFQYLEGYAFANA